MKIIKKTTKEKVIKTTIYQTKHFDVVETVINDKLDSIRLTCDDKDLTPMMLNAPDWNQYKDFYYFLDQRIEIKSLDDIDLNKVYFAYTAGHVLFDLNKKPVSIPCLFNYIGSLKERHQNDKVYERLISLLKEHSFVIELKTDNIPYYNAAFSGQRGISFAKILLSQEKYEELYNKCKGGDYWSVRMKNNIGFALNTDIYGNEIKDLLEEYHN